MRYRPKVLGSFAKLILLTSFWWVLVIAIVVVIVPFVVNSAITSMIRSRWLWCLWLGNIGGFVMVCHDRLCSGSGRCGYCCLVGKCTTFLNNIDFILKCI